MRISAMFGIDTGMYLVDVYLETDREVALSHHEVWVELRELLAAEKVDVQDVVDFFLLHPGPDGTWVSNGQLDWRAQ